jgi:hypothetical protein
MWVWVLLCIGGVCFLLLGLIFRVASDSFRFLVELLSFGFDVLCPCQFSIEMDAHVLISCYGGSSMRILYVSICVM